MKKTRLLTIVLILALMLSLNMVASAAAAGPFESGAPDNVGGHMDFEDLYASGLNAWDALQPALDGRNFLADPVFVDGAEGFGGEDGAEVGSPDGEWAWNTLVMDWHKLNADGDMRSSKYCGNEGMWWDGGFFVEWRYDQAYVADAFYLATGNDCAAYPRRMGDGWTFSGSNDGSNWTVLYTGKGEDYQPITLSWWRFDLPDNSEAFQYYRIWAGDRHDDQDIIQISVLAVSGNLPNTGGGDPEELVPAPVVSDAPATPAAPTPAPATVDPISLIAIGALASATGVLFIKKRKN